MPTPLEESLSKFEHRPFSPSELDMLAYYYDIKMKHGKAAALKYCGFEGYFTFRYCGYLVDNL